MANPSTTARSSPGGIPLHDGYSCLIAFSRDADVSFWEKTVQPPGYDGGDKIDFTTMHNDSWRTFAPRALITLTDSPITVLYDPNFYSQILSLINMEGSVTVHFPDGSTLDFWGFLKSFEPSPLVEGEPPEATVNIVCTNWDPTNNVEAGPVFTNVSGT